MTSGIILIDKPQGLSSNHALQKVRRLFGAHKAGHSGTLDPMATGMLPIFLEQATKTIGYMLHVDKAYRATFQLGQATSTGDAEGEITKEAPVPVLTRDSIEAILPAFRGVISQIPPMYSAVKHQGKPLYRLAIQGVGIERKPRLITIHQLELLDFTADTLTLDIVCSKGTYIRTLAEDMAKKLGTHGHVIALHRLYCAGFSHHPMILLEDLLEMDSAAQKACILPTDAGLMHWPMVQISREEEQLLLLGRSVILDQPVQNGPYRLYESERLLALATIEDQRIVTRRFVVG